MSRRLISENVEVNKEDQYTEPNRIEMLQDVGMMKVYPKCVVKAVNVDRVVTLSWNTPPCSWTFPPVGFSMQLPVASENRLPSLHLYLFLWETLLLPLFLYFIWSASCMTTCEHLPCTYKLALKVCHHKHTAKYDSFYDTPCARVCHASHQIKYLWLELERVHSLEIYTRNERTMINMDSATLVVNDTVPIGHITQRTTVQDTAKSAAKNLTCKGWQAASHDLEDVLH